MTLSLYKYAGCYILVILVRRVQERSERLWWEVQGGFRPGRGYIDQIFSLRMITEKKLTLNRKVFCDFVDFDKVVRVKSWERLRQYNVYRDHSACVRVGAGMSPGLTSNRVLINEVAPYQLGCSICISKYTAVSKE